MGQPLIGDTQMLAIHEAMVRLRALERLATPGQPHNAAAHAAGVRQPRPIALLAATLLQLRPTDTLFTDAPDDLAAEVLAIAQEAAFSPQHADPIDAGPHAAAIALGHALAVARSTRPGDDAPVTVALLHSLPEGFGELLRFTGEAMLPLLIIVQAGPVQHSAAIASRENVESIRIDADDAVACCRVMQESLLRARNRWGAVVLQGVVLPAATDPLSAFEAHLRRRNLTFPV